jgi:serine/threonine-protein kinase
MVAGMPSHFRLDLAISLVNAHVLVLRAALVPTSPRKTAVMGVLASIPVVLTTSYMQSMTERPPWAPTAVLGILPTMIWCAVTIISTTVMSFVIYGLRQKVEAAMELGQYTLLDKIGEGGMGVVYRARHALLRRPTAVKLLRPDSARDASIARFEREVQLTADISHPNIVSVYDFGRTPEGSFYYAMEFLCGMDLQRLVADHGPQPPERVLPILVQAADALAEAHAVGLVHRDVKPANMILCNSERHPDRLKMFDFGLVKSAGPEVTISQENALRGTPLYMSPEAITSPDSIDGRADIYALGAVGYFLLTGRPVFEGNTVFEVCAQHLHQPVIPPSERAGVAFPKKLEALLLACLAKSPADRPASASALREALLACDDVGAWSHDDARRWWASNPIRARAQDDGQSAVVKTFAVAPRAAAPVKRASA